MANRYVTYNDLSHISNSVQSSPSVGFKPLLIITAPVNCTITVSLGDTVLPVSYFETDYRVEVPSYGKWKVTCAKTINGEVLSYSKYIDISIVQIYMIDISYAPRYGYRIKESESDPNARVEYILDAEGMTPAFMDFANGVFNYGSWKDVWFVKNNKSCMLKYDGTVDYYLDPNDYSKKEDGTESDVANTGYEGNVMSEIPLVWIKRYEDETYKYEIISTHKVDDDYYAYAHTRKDGSVADYFYWSAFQCGRVDDRLRSIKGLSSTTGISYANAIQFAGNNGESWTVHLWMQSECLRTLCCLIGKTTGLQNVFGYGYNANSHVIGTQIDKGQFFGANNQGVPVKIFHIEDFWGSAWDLLLGLKAQGTNYYIKPSPEGGYDDLDLYDIVTMPRISLGWRSAVSMSKFGALPRNHAGSSTTYYMGDDVTIDSSNLRIAQIGGSTSRIYSRFCLATDMTDTSWGRNIEGASISCIP